MLQRLVLEYERGSYSEVLEGLTSLELRCRKLGMTSVFVKIKILQATALKNLGRFEDAITPLKEGLQYEGIDVGVKATLLEHLGESYMLEGHPEEASSCLQEAFVLLRSANRPIATAWLKMLMGEALRIRGGLQGALDAYRDAERAYAVLGLPTWVAYARLLTAEVLLALDRDQEAEAEIRRAIPTIEDQQMVPEGLAALALLRECIRQQNSDRNALRELAEHLRGTN
jgi:tetratricopeptide (TPR) repeat protein